MVERKQGQTGLYRVESLGCRANRYEADAVALYFRKAGWREALKDERADIVLLNTCTVTSEAGRKSRQSLRRLRKQNPQAIIAAMGCHAQLADIKELCDLSTGTQNRLKLAQDCLSLWQERQAGAVTLTSQLPATTTAATTVATATTAAISAAVAEELGAKNGVAATVAADFVYEELGIIDKQSELRAQLKIQDGCDNACSYCAIRLARGRSRSRSRAAIMTEAQALIAQGVKEIVLTGIHLCSFEKELGRGSLALASLLSELAAVEGLERLRLGSLEPAAVTAEFIQELKQVPKLCPSFHLSLQSGSPTVLKRMRRQYSPELVAQVIQGLRQAFPEAGISCDVICAFPEETEAEFAESLNFVERMEFSKVHVFPFSLRAGTAAAKLKQLAPVIVRQRSQIMLQLATSLAEAAAQKALGHDWTVLLEEQDEAGCWRGYTQSYLPFAAHYDVGSQVQAGDIVTLRADSQKGDLLCWEQTSSAL